MSVYLYTLRKSAPKTVKTQNGKLPIFHYEFSNGNVSQDWLKGGWDEYTAQNIHRAITRFYQREEVEIRDEWRWEWRTEIQYNEPKAEYADGILVTHYRTNKKYKTQNQPIYYQKTPVVQWFDTDEGDRWKGIQVGQMVDGKAHFTRAGADLLFEKINVIIAPERVFPPNIQSA